MARKKHPDDDLQLPLFDLPLQRDGGAADFPIESAPIEDAVSIDDVLIEDTDLIEDAGSIEEEESERRFLELDVPAEMLQELEDDPPASPPGPRPKPVPLPLFPAKESDDIDPDDDADQTDSLPSEPEPARIQDRLLAGLADLSIIALVLAVTTAGVLLMGVPLTTSDLGAFGVLGLLFSFLYTTIPLAFWGQTPGMAWLGLMTYGPDPDHEPLTFSQTLWRWLGAVATLALAGLPLLMALRGESLSDRLSRSQTVAL